MSDKPRVNLTEEQIAAQMKAKAEFKRRMVFIKEKFWPALCDAATSIEDAKVLLTGFNNTVMQTFLTLMKEKNIKDLELSTKLDAASDKFLENAKLLELFNDMSVFEAKEYIEGMRHELDTFIMDEMKERPLSSLKVKWIDEVQEELLSKDKQHDS